jgi:hypothetical protein
MSLRFWSEGLFVIFGSDLTAAVGVRLELAFSIAAI